MRMVVMPHPSKPYDPCAKRKADLLIYCWFFGICPIMCALPAMLRNLGLMNMTNLIKALPFYEAVTTPMRQLVQQMKTAKVQRVPHWTEYLHEIRDSEN